MSTLHEFDLWEPLLRVLRAARAPVLDAPGGYVAGVIARGAGTEPWRLPNSSLPLEAPDRAAAAESVERLQDAVDDALVEDVVFVAEIAADGQAVVHLFTYGPAVEPGFDRSFPGTLLLVEGAVAEPWRRLPEPTPGAGPAPSADPDLLERVLREQVPGVVGASATEIAAAEARLGAELPEEVRALYRATGARREDRGGGLGTDDCIYDVLGFWLFPLDEAYVADLTPRPFSWEYGAMEASVTGPDDAVQDLPASPGWIVIGLTVGGDVVAVDLTPGPRGHTGQVIVLSHGQLVGAVLLAESLTDLVGQPTRRLSSARAAEEPPVVVHLSGEGRADLEHLAHPDLEVLGLRGWRGEPLSLAPVVGLPRLRTLSASAGSLADPAEIAGLNALEYLALSPPDWRILLDADGLPPGLSAAAVQAGGSRDPRPVMALANEILARWQRPLITETVLRGVLQP